MYPEQIDGWQRLAAVQAQELCTGLSVTLHTPGALVSHITQQPGQ